VQHDHLLLNTCLVHFPNLRILRRGQRWYVKRCSRDCVLSFRLSVVSNNALIYTFFRNEGLWIWLVVLAALTFSASTIFVLIEIFRETKVDGGTQAKGSCESTVEGVCFFFLVLAWIVSVLFATTPGGPASLIGNAYFFTWLLVIFVFEGMVWYIHDMRQALHRALEEKEDEYKARQKQILEETKRIQERNSDSGSSKFGRERSQTEFFDAEDAF
jgi:hypothetical protein